MALDFSFLQSATNSGNTSPYTFAAQNFGTAHADRFIIACIEVRGTGPTTVSNVTIGGVAATVVSQPVGNGNVAAIAIAAVPTGTSGNVVFSVDGSPLRAALQLYRAVGIDSSTPYDTATSVADPPSGSLDVPAGGFAIGCVASGIGGFAWTGLTEDADGDVETMGYTSASDEFATLQTGLVITADPATVGAAPGAFASWAPIANDIIPGTIVLTHAGPGEIKLTETVAATEGDGIIVRQWQRSVNGGAYSDLVGETGATLTDTDVAPDGTQYTYRIHYTDDGIGDEVSNDVTSIAYNGGTGGGGSKVLMG